MTLTVLLDRRTLRTTYARPQAPAANGRPAKIAIVVLEAPQEGRKATPAGWRRSESQTSVSGLDRPSRTPPRHANRGRHPGRRGRPGHPACRSSPWNRRHQVKDTYARPDFRSATRARCRRVAWQPRLEIGRTRVHPERAKSTDTLICGPAGNSVSLHPALVRLARGLARGVPWAIGCRCSYGTLPSSRIDDRVTRGATRPAR